MPVPDGLPSPVDRFIRALCRNTVPAIESVLISGRATKRPMFNIALLARFHFSHRAGRDYRHYFEATLFGLPILKVDEGYVGGVSFFESIMGSNHHDPSTNQGAHLALWTEAGMFPSLRVCTPVVGDTPSSGVSCSQGRHW